MQYRDNGVDFTFKIAGAAVESGSLQIEDFDITDGQDPDGEITKGRTFTMKDGKLNFRIGRKETNQTADQFYSKISASETTWGKREDKLNFALIGRLELELKVILDKTRILRFTFNDVALAQFSEGNSNQWFFGGKNGKFFGNRSCEITGKGAGSVDDEYTFIFKGDKVHEIEIMSINGKNNITGALKNIKSATISTFRVPVNGRNLSVSEAIDALQTVPEILAYFRRFLPAKYVDQINDIAYKDESNLAEKAYTRVMVYTMTSPNGEPKIHSQHSDWPFLPEKTHHENMLLAPDNSNNELLYNAIRIGNGGITRINKTILNNPGSYSLIIPRSLNDHPQQNAVSGALSQAFFFQDGKRTFFVSHSEEPDKFAFQTFYHAHTGEFFRQLGLKGIRGLLDRAMQSQDDAMYFEYTYKPVDAKSTNNAECIVRPYPTDKVDFEFEGTYAQYNWELFFHIPLYIAAKLSNNQQFEEARRWFHYIFDPTSGEEGGKERFWKFKPFYNEAQSPIQTMDDLLRTIDKISDQVNEWMENPFNPHAVARMRILAYMKNVVMKYIDNLLAWADQLFRRDTIESINEATQLYILAAKILGDRPQRVPARVRANVQKYRTLSPKLDAFSNAMVAIEAFIPPSGVLDVGRAPLNTMAYFLLDKNEKLLGYWDTVADRLFKIRHSMNIKGVERAPALFEPPIDPALLVRAAAAGLSLDTVLNDMNAPLPHYRFNFMLQKANELCADVKSLGSALLAALEKRDAEQLALIRQSHEAKVLEAVRSVKASQAKEAEQNLEALHKSKEAAELRFEYYSSRPLINDQEQLYLDSIKAGIVLQAVQGGLQTAGAVAAAIPDLKIGAATSVGATFGGSNLSAAFQAKSAYLGILAAINSAKGSLASTMGGFHRRADDWEFQANSATKELEQLEKQILAGEIRMAVANRELAVHDMQIENAREIDDFMTGKFTNRQLYDWMIGQLSTIYFQSYQLAYDLAKRAQRCYNHELGTTDASFIEFGYWDGLKKGLLSGEKLQYDLRRMEASYLQENKRELEIQKHISLALIAPNVLLDLKKSGKCTVEFPEVLFDLDYPGHYFRRLKTVSITIPCVTSPFTTVNCTLRLTKHQTRINTALQSPSEYYMTNDASFRTLDTMQTVACSSAQNDSGLFELNFRDERYLPFEGCGVVNSKWELSLMEAEALRQFDYETISDVIFHIKYTAKEDSALKQAAVACLQSNLASLTHSERVFSVRHEFPSQWHRFLHGAGSNGYDILELAITKEMFPFFAQDKKIKISKLVVNAKCKQNEVFTLTLNSGSILMNTSPLSGWLEGSLGLNNQQLSGETWRFSVSEGENPEIEDLYLCVSYNLAEEIQ